MCRVRDTWSIHVHCDDARATMACPGSEGEGAKLRAMARKHVEAPALHTSQAQEEKKGGEEASPLRTPRGSFDARTTPDTCHDARDADRGEVLPNGACVSLLVLRNREKKPEDKENKLVHELEGALRKRHVELNQRTVLLVNGTNGTEEACYGCAAAIALLDAAEWDPVQVADKGRRVMEAVLSMGVPRMICALVERRHKANAKAADQPDKNEQQVEDAWVKILKDMDKAKNQRKRNVLWTVVRIKAPTNWSRMLSCMAGNPTLVPVATNGHEKKCKPLKVDEEEMGRLLADLVVHIPPELQRQVLQVGAFSKKGRG